MPTLLLLRHAKSSWDDPSLKDADRPLDSRGIRAAPKIGAEIARREWVPDHAIVSTALRAWQTWDLASSQWDDCPEPSFDDRIYMAMPAVLRSIAAGVPANVQTLMIVGHNPGLADFALSLAGNGSDKKAVKKLTRKFPTAALARIQLSGWANLSEGSGRLTHCIKPKDLK